LARAARSQSLLAVLFLDLDDFKLVNDSFGHAAGDDLLVAVAGRLTKSLRVGDTAARFGGDEFAVLLEEVAGFEEANQVAERIITELRVPLTLKIPVQVHASIGYRRQPRQEPKVRPSCFRPPMWQCTLPSPAAKVVTRCTSPHCNRPC